MTRFLLSILLLLAPAFGQRPSQPAFEVASVKPVEGSRGTMYNFSSSGPRVRYIAYAATQLVMEAYNVRNYQVIFPPTAAPPSGGEYGTAYYDIEAKAEGGRARSRDEFRPMLQTLLADRFKLRAHRETKEIPAYALLVAKGGPKFKESSPNATESTQTVVSGRNQSITASKTSMDELAQMIGGAFALDRPVVDRTGLAGAYDFKIEASPEWRMKGDDSDLRNISIFTAVQEQLGLRLASQKAMIEVLVVDHVEKPSPN
jgi:uncharacterized protein (TIGR03435 family)